MLNLIAVTSCLMLMSLFACKKQAPLSQTLVVNGTTTGIEAFHSVLRISAERSFSTESGLETFQGLASCSSTVVGPNLILTAAHCVVDDTGQKADNVFVTTDDGQKISGGNVILHPNYDKPTVAYDIALVQFPQDALKAYAPIPIAKMLPGRGQTIAIVGYGKFNHLDPNSGGTKRWGTNTVDNDDPQSARTIDFTGGVTPDGDGTGNQVLNSQGDSGGPMLSKEGLIVGVSSTVDINDGAKQLTGHYTNVGHPVIADFLNQHKTTGQGIAGLSDQINGQPVAFANPLPSQPGAQPNVAPIEGYQPPVSEDGVTPEMIQGDRPINILTQAVYGPCSCRVVRNKVGLGCTIFNAAGMPVLESASPTGCKTHGECFATWGHAVVQHCSNLGESANAPAASQPQHPF